MVGWDRSLMNTAALGLLRDVISTWQLNWDSWVPPTVFVTGHTLFSCLLRNDEASCHVHSLRQGPLWSLATTEDSFVLHISSALCICLWLEAFATVFHLLPWSSSWKVEQVPESPFQKCPTFTFFDFLFSCSRAYLLPTFLISTVLMHAHSHFICGLQVLTQKHLKKKGLLSVVWGSWAVFSIYTSVSYLPSPFLWAFRHLNVIFNKLGQWRQTLCKLNPFGTHSWEETRV